MEKAVCYIRIGPEEERFGPSADDQQDALVAYCKINDLDVVTTVKDESVSGSLPVNQRLGGNDLENIMESSGVTNIVCFRLDRLFKNAIEADGHLQSWTDRGVVLHIVDMGGVGCNTGAEHGPPMMRILSGFAQLERDMASERTRSAIAVKKANRFVYGATPYGYDQDGNQLTVNEKEQAIVKSVRSWHEEGWSLRKIANKLNDTKVPTKRAGTKRNATKWDASTARYLLANPLYSGASKESTEQNPGAGE